MTEPAVAFLRAVNVGGRNRVPQKALAERLERELGSPVRHLLQSGNLVFRAAEPSTLAATVAGAIREQTGLEIPVIVRTGAQLAALATADPWPGEDPIRVALSLWDDPHDEADARAMAEADWAGEELRFVPGGAWMRYVVDTRSAKLGNAVIERRLKVTATARNARTIGEVLALLRSLGE